MSESKAAAVPMRDDNDIDDAPSVSSSSGKIVSSPQQLMMMGTITTIVIRSISFIGTQYCIRTFHTPITLGTNVQFELIMTAILFLSREGFRLAITQNTTSITSSNTNKTTAAAKEKNNDLQLGGSGVALLTIPVTLVMSILALAGHYYYCSLYIRNSSTTIQNVEEYKIAGLLYCIAAFIEGCGEPVVLYTLQNLSVTEKASAEGIATIVKTLTTIASMNHTKFIHQPLIVLGMAQIMYAMTYCSVLYGTIYQRGHWLRVIPLYGKSPSTPTTIWWHTPTMRLVVLFTIQGILKFILTEGDRIILSIVADNYNQGLYALGCAYGGLAARLLLQPMEETSRLLYSRLANISSSDNATNGTSSDGNKHAKRTNKEPSVLEVSYTVLVKMVLYIGLTFCCLGVNYTYILLNILAGRVWGNNPEAVGVLSGFCVYTAFLAWNGMTEAFVYGISQTAYDIGRLGIAHTVTGGLFALIAPVAVTQYGTIGLVASNCITMIARIGFSVYFAARYFSHKEGTTIPHTIIRLLRQMIPEPMVLALFIIAFFGTQQSSHRMMLTIDADKIVPTSLPWFRLAFEHIGVGVTFAVGIISLAYSLEKDFLQSVRKLWHQKKG
jgi:oligosaccharide translocation protein RFT1